MALRVAQALAIASLILLVIYGADEAAKSGREEGGFLHIDAMSRGLGLGGSAVALSTAAFFISMKERSVLVSILLLVNGVLIILGGAMAATLSISQDSNATGAYAVLGLGVWILALGIIKSTRARALRTA